MWSVIESARAGVSTPSQSPISSWICTKAVSWKRTNSALYTCGSFGFTKFSNAERLRLSTIYEEWHAAALYPCMAVALVASVNDKPFCFSSIENRFSSFNANRNERSLNIDIKSVGEALAHVTKGSDVIG